MQPLNRLLMTAARGGLTIEPDTITTSRAPTSRELVNFIGAGFNQITIGDPTDCRDKFGLEALEELKEKQVITLG